MYVASLLTLSMLTYKFLHWRAHISSRDLLLLSLSLDLQMIQRAPVSEDDSPYTEQRWLQASEQSHVSMKQIILACRIAHSLQLPSASDKIRVHGVKVERIYGKLLQTCMLY